MYGAAIAAHINQSMAAYNLSAKYVSSESKTPESTLSNYRTGKVEKPNEEQLLRIFAVWGDGPEVLYNIRKQVDETAAAEARLKASAKDKELIDQIAEVIKAGSMALLDQQAERVGAQQSEILRHADARVEEERRRFKARADEVLRQCTAEIAKNESICNEKIAMTEKHVRELLTLKDEQIKKSDAENEKVRAYLRVVVRNLTVALIAVAVFAVVGLACLGGYAFYAYQTFDLKDPTRGMYRGGASIGPIVLTLLVVGAVGAIAFFIFLFFNARKKKG